jgi:hypothetical protein
VPYITKDNEVAFEVPRNWVGRQTAMYTLKRWFNEDNLVNGQDYLFLQIDNSNCIKVRFAEPSNCSFYALKYKCQEKV